MIEVPGFRPPRQARSRATLEALTDAVGELVTDAGVDPTVRELVQRAGISVGAFYARFDERDAVLAYASHDFWALSRRRWSEYLEPDRWDDVSAARIVVTVVRVFARMMLADRRRTRAFVRLSLSVEGGSVFARVSEHDRFIAGAVADLVADRPGEVRHPTPRHAADEGFRAVLGAVRDRVAFGPVEPDSRADRSFILSLCQMYGCYLDLHPIPSSYAELLRMTCRHEGRVHAR